MFLFLEEKQDFMKEQLWCLNKMMQTKPVVDKFSSALGSCQPENVLYLL